MADNGKRHHAVWLDTRVALIILLWSNLPEGACVDETRSCSAWRKGSRTARLVQLARTQVNSSEQSGVVMVPRWTSSARMESVQAWPHKGLPRIRRARADQALAFPPTLSRGHQYRNRSSQTRSCFAASLRN